MVKWYGEAEFWLSLGKVFLIGIVYSFTLITMVGGNPKKDAYGVSLLAQISAGYELTRNSSGTGTSQALSQNTSPLARLVDLKASLAVCGAQHSL